MEMLPKTAQRIYVEKILTEALRVIKLSNSAAFYSLDQDDFDYLAAGLEGQFMAKGIERGKKILDEAIAEFGFLAMRTGKVDVGEFNRLSYSIKSRFDEDDRTRKLIAPVNKGQSKKQPKEWFAEFREHLKNAIKPLPYDKNWRV